MKIVNSPTAGWRTLRKLSVAAACVGLLTVSAPAVAGASLAPALSKPTVVSFKATPSHLSAAGGTVTLTAKVKGATTCIFSGHGTVTVSCSSGSAKVKDKIAAVSYTHLHIGFVHRWAARYVAEGLTEMVEEPDEAEMVSAAPSDDLIISWVADGHAALVEVLSSAPPDVQCWT